MSAQTFESACKLLQTNIEHSPEQSISKLLCMVVAVSCSVGAGRLYGTILLETAKHLRLGQRLIFQQDSRVA